MANPDIITSDADLWADNTITGTKFSTGKKKQKIRGRHMFLCFWHREVMLRSSGFRRFPSDFCAVPNLPVFSASISLVWNWLAAVWICHWELQWLGFRGNSAYFCGSCTVPTHPFKCDLGLEMMWFDVSRSPGTEISFWEKNKNNFHSIAVLEQRMRRSGRLKCPSIWQWISIELYLRKSQKI